MAGQPCVPRVLPMACPMLVCIASDLSRAGKALLLAESKKSGRCRPWPGLLEHFSISDVPFKSARLQAVHLPFACNLCTRDHACSHETPFRLGRISDHRALYSLRRRNTPYLPRNNRLFFHALESRRASGIEKLKLISFHGDRTCSRTAMRCSQA